MKSILVSAAAVLSLIGSQAAAHRGPNQGGHHHSAPHYHRHQHHQHHWVAPLIIGGIVGYTLSRPQPVVVIPPPEPLPSYPPPQGFHYEQRFDRACNCWRLFVVADPY